MAENRRNPRFEEDDYELRRLEKRRQRQHEAYLRKKKREKMILIFSTMILMVLILSITAGAIRKRRATQGDFNDTRTNAPNEERTSGSAIEKSTEGQGTVSTTLETKGADTQTTAGSTPDQSSSGTSSESTELITLPSTEATEPPTEATAVYVEPTGQGPETVFERRAAIPSWITKDLLHISEKNRPGTKLGTVKNVVIHWVGNATSSAKDNRDYFESLANPKVNEEGIGASSHFIVGLQGEILQCVPIEEVAYANYPRNNDTISIEVCHPDWEGKFSDVTYASVVKLAAWALEISGLTADDLIRHYDVRGKECPKYYVQHPEAWEQLKADVRQYMSEHPDIAKEFP